MKAVLKPIGFMSLKKHTYMFLFCRNIVEIIEPYYNRNPNRNKETVIGKALIKCKRSDYDYFPYSPDYNSSILNSKGWTRTKSYGDHFVINPKTRFRTFYDQKIKSFAHLGIRRELVAAVLKMGVCHPTVIQAKVIPQVLNKKSLVIGSTAGTGKTLSYLLPVMTNLLKKNSSFKSTPNHPRVIIITPTKELAWQISGVIDKLSDILPINQHLLTGGSIRKKLLNAKVNQVDIIVGSVGAVSKFITAKIYDFSELETIVSEEIDLLFSDDFLPKVQYIFKKLNENSCMSLRQLLFIAGIVPSSLLSMIQSEFSVEDPWNSIDDHINHLLPHVRHEFFRITKSQKADKLLEILKHAPCKRFVIFSNSHKTSYWITQFLTENGFDSVYLNSHVPHKIRKEQFEQLQSNISIISCTDLVARGIDTVTFNAVINFDFPSCIINYINRAGRVGRLGDSSNNVVYNLISSKSEINLVQAIEKAVRDVHKNNQPNLTSVIN